MSKVIIALGSNIEPRLDYLKQAVKRISELGNRIRVSSIYESAPIGFSSETDFYNAVLLLETEELPIELLQKLKKIEKEIGRKEKTMNVYEARKIDLDIIGYEQHVIINEKLIIPHVSFRERRFVLEPLCEIYPEWRDPVTQSDMYELLKKTKDRSELRKINFSILQ
jgi:2-amino-4-hydroxy-6-hydroxymethyldihydropteridine diphosphokinase